MARKRITILLAIRGYSTGRREALSPSRARIVCHTSALPMLNPLGQVRARTVNPQRKSCRAHARAREAWCTFYSG
jgi:hypothetical protein